LSQRNYFGPRNFGVFASYYTETLLYSNFHAPLFSRTYQAREIKSTRKKWVLQYSILSEVAYFNGRAFSCYMIRSHKSERLFIFISELLMISLLFMLFWATKSLLQPLWCVTSCVKCCCFSACLVAMIKCCHLALCWRLLTVGNIFSNYTNRTASGSELISTVGFSNMQKMLSRVL